MLLSLGGHEPADEAGGGDGSPLAEWGGGRATPLLLPPGD